MINGVPQNQTQIEKMQNMSIEELKHKQQLAIDLYNEANGMIPFVSVKHNLLEIQKGMARCAGGTNVILIDLNESKSSKEFIFLVFDCEK